MSFRLPLTVASGLLALSLACAADPESGQLGTCSLNCSNAKVGSVNFIIEPLSPVPYPNWECGSGVTELGPITIRYRIYEEVPRFPNDSRNSDSEGEGEGDAGGPVLMQAPMEIVPKGAIGFEPWVVGAMSVAQTHEEFKNGDVVSPYRFRGVVTPSGEWCSDSCGVMAYEIAPECVAAAQNDVVAGVMVHGIRPADAISFSVTTAGN